MRRSSISIALLLLAVQARGQRSVSIPIEGQNTHLQADLYGTGARALLLAHGGRFNKESWRPQAQVFANAGLLVLALRFRGDTVNKDNSPSAEGSYEDNAEDVQAAFAYLHGIGSKTISAIGASLGGDAVGEADARSKPGEIERIVFLGSDGGDHAGDLKGRKLFLVARGDANGSGLRLRSITEHYNQAPQPKTLTILEGSAHAQFLFNTEQGPRLLKELLKFLSEP